LEHVLQPPMLFTYFSSQIYLSNVKENVRNIGSGTCNYRCRNFICPYSTVFNNK